MIKGDGALTEIPPFEAKWYEQKSIEILQPVCQDEMMRMRIYQLKLTKSSTYFYHVVMSVSSLARWNRLYIDTKIYYSAY